MDPVDERINAAAGVDEGSGLHKVQLLQALATHGVYHALRETREAQETRLHSPAQSNDLLRDDAQC